MENYRILLVDDDPFVLQSIGPILVKKGYEVTTAENGQKAIDFLSESTFDLVLTDLVMEDVDGFQVLRAVKAVDKDTMVIILTGYEEVKLAIDCLRLGADDYVLKPCEPEELFFRLNNCFAKLEDKRKVKQAEETLKKSEEKWRSLTENAPVMIVHLDREGLIKLINNIPEGFGLIEDNILGRNNTDFCAEEYRAQSQEIQNRVLNTGVSESLEMRGAITDKWYHSTIGALKEDGKTVGLTAINVDITERKQVEQELQKAHEELETKVEIRTAELEQEITKRKQAEEQIKVSLKDKEMLLQEIHHRVKNNLQIISSLLKLQANHIDDEAIKGTLLETQNRVYTMTTVHEMLYGSESLSDININSYISKLSKTLHQLYSANPDQVKLTIECDEINLDIEEASSLGLIVNELISNSLKYAFPDERNGEINLNVKKLGSSLELTVMDNGIGFPKDFDLENTNTFGLRLVKILSENEFGGSIQLKQDQDTRFVIKLKL